VVRLAATWAALALSVVAAAQPSLTPKEVTAGTIDVRVAAGSSPRYVALVRCPAKSLDFQL
jgi:hypothetical protein